MAEIVFAAQSFGMHLISWRNLDIGSTFTSVTKSVATCNLHKIRAKLFVVVARLGIGQEAIIDYWQNNVQSADSDMEKS